MEEDRVFDFLAGLHVDYEPLKFQLIGQVPFPTLQEAHARIQNEEKRRQAMVPRSAPSDRSALVVSKPAITDTLDQKLVASFADKDQLRCDHCHKPRHTRDSCFILHPHLRGRGRGRGRNSSFPGRSAGGGRGHSAHYSAPEEHFPETVSSPHPTGLTASEMSSLRHLLTRMDSDTGTSTSQSSSHIAHAGISYALASAVSSSSWIIDSGASEHMTGSSSVLHSYIYSPGNDNVRLADGSLVPIHGRGSTQCISNIPQFYMFLLFLPISYLSSVLLKPLIVQ